MNAIPITTDFQAWMGAASSPFEIVQPRYPLARGIIKQTAADHGMAVADLTGPRRFRRYSHARFDAMTRLRAIQHDGKPRYSLPHIGMMLGGRDHTSVLYGIRRWADMQRERGQ